MPNNISIFFKKLLNLQDGADEKNTIIDSIKEDADFSGARFWTLVFAIGLASVGLNINSTPVIIGAMLISPLMGPIVSIGLATSINDWDLMRKSFRNLMILTIISIIVSALYFSISPISNAQSELLARIQPTIFDVLIAIFGGLAGFIGLSRAKQGNIIPGVAIATALMPPLCTVGYGIATMQTPFIFGALYLYIINSIFIFLSSFVMSSYLSLPKKKYESEIKRKKVKFLIVTIIIIVIIPAVHTAYRFVEENNFTIRANTYISSTFEDRGYVVIYKDLDYSSKEKSIELAFLSEHFSDSEIEDFKKQLKYFQLNDTKLIIRQNDFSLTQEEWQSVIGNLNGGKEKMEALELRLENQNLEFENPTRLLKELQIIYPNITNISVSVPYYAIKEENNSGKIILVSISDKDTISNEEFEKIREWFKARLNLDQVFVYFE